ncbi:hypothetical protein DIPPA_01321 [Diplonema papillatum]|nr:hypothetical protein DIPPA_01321 [Diplonema papillatum]
MEGGRRKSFATTVTTATTPTSSSSSSSSLVTSDGRSPSSSHASPVRSPRNDPTGASTRDDDDLPAIDGIELVESPLSRPQISLPLPQSASHKPAASPGPAPPRRDSDRDAHDEPPEQSERGDADLADNLVEGAAPLPGEASSPLSGHGPQGDDRDVGPSEERAPGDWVWNESAAEWQWDDTAGVQGAEKEVQESDHAEEEEEHEPQGKEGSPDEGKWVWDESKQDWVWELDEGDQAAVPNPEEAEEGQEQGAAEGRWVWNEAKQDWEWQEGERQHDEPAEEDLGGSRYQKHRPASVRVDSVEGTEGGAVGVEATDDGSVSEKEAGAGRWSWSSSQNDWKWAEAARDPGGDPLVADQDNAQHTVEEDAQTEEEQNGGNVEQQEQAEQGEWIWDEGLSEYNWVPAATEQTPDEHAGEAQHSAEELQEQEGKEEQQEQTEQGEWVWDEALSEYTWVPAEEAKEESAGEEAYAEGEWVWREDLQDYEWVSADRDPSSTPSPTEHAPQLTHDSVDIPEVAFVPDTDGETDCFSDDNPPFPNPLLAENLDRVQPPPIYIPALEVSALRSSNDLEDTVVIRPVSPTIDLLLRSPEDAPDEQPETPTVDDLLDRTAPTGKDARAEPATVLDRAVQTDVCLEDFAVIGAAADAVYLQDLEEAVRLVLEAPESSPEREGEMTASASGGDGEETGGPPAAEGDGGDAEDGDVPDVAVVVKLTEALQRELWQSALLRQRLRQAETNSARLTRDLQSAADGNRTLHEISRKERGLRRTAEKMLQKKKKAQQSAAESPPDSDDEIFAPPRTVGDAKKGKKKKKKPRAQQLPVHERLFRAKTQSMLAADQVFDNYFERFSRSPCHGPRAGSQENHHPTSTNPANPVSFQNLSPPPPRHTRSTSPYHRLARTPSPPPQPNARSPVPTPPAAKTGQAHTLVLNTEEVDFLRQVLTSRRSAARSSDGEAKREEPSPRLVDLNEGEKKSLAGMLSRANYGPVSAARYRRPPQERGRAWDRKAPLMSPVPRAEPAADDGSAGGAAAPAASPPSRQARASPPVTQRGSSTTPFNLSTNLYSRQYVIPNDTADHHVAHPRMPHLTPEPEAVHRRVEFTEAGAPPPNDNRGPPVGTRRDLASAPGGQPAGRAAQREVVQLRADGGQTVAVDGVGDGVRGGDFRDDRALPAAGAKVQSPEWARGDSLHSHYVERAGVGLSSENTEIGRGFEGAGIRKSVTKVGISVERAEQRWQSPRKSFGSPEEAGNWLLSAGERVVSLTGSTASPLNTPSPLRRLLPSVSPPHTHGAGSEEDVTRRHGGEAEGTELHRTQTADTTAKEKGLWDRLARPRTSSTTTRPTSVLMYSGREYPAILRSGSQSILTEAHPATQRPASLTKAKLRSRTDQSIAAWADSRHQAREKRQAIADGKKLGTPYKVSPWAGVKSRVAREAAAAAAARRHPSPEPSHQQHPETAEPDSFVGEVSCGPPPVPALPAVARCGGGARTPSPPVRHPTFPDHSGRQPGEVRSFEADSPRIGHKPPSSTHGSAAAARSPQAAGKAPGPGGTDDSSFAESLEAAEAQPLGESRGSSRTEMGGEPWNTDDSDAAADTPETAGRTRGGGQHRSPAASPRTAAEGGPPGKAAEVAGAPEEARGKTAPPSDAPEASERDARNSTLPAAPREGADSPRVQSPVERHAPRPEAPEASERAARDSAPPAASHERAGTPPGVQSTVERRTPRPEADGKAGGGGRADSPRVQNAVEGHAPRPEAPGASERAARDSAPPAAPRERAGTPPGVHSTVERRTPKPEADGKPGGGGRAAQRRPGGRPNPPQPRKGGAEPHPSPAGPKRSDPPAPPQARPAKPRKPPSSKAGPGKGQPSKPAPAEQKQPDPPRRRPGGRGEPGGGRRAADAAAGRCSRADPPDVGSDDNMVVSPCSSDRASFSDAAAPRRPSPAGTRSPAALTPPLASRPSPSPPPPAALPAGIPPPLSSTSYAARLRPLQPLLPAA